MGDRTPDVVAVTADVVEGVEEDCLEAGMLSYLSKPVSMQKVHDFFKSSGVLQKSDVACMRELPSILSRRESTID